MPVPESLRALMTGVIDYAGLFPPAALPLDESIRNYARYRNDPDRWMLGRFICPTTRLDELLPYVDELFDQREPVAISALARTTKSFAEVVPEMTEDLKAVETFRAAPGGRAVVDVLELRLPEILRDLMPMMFGAIEQFSAEVGLRPFCELGFDASWKNSLLTTIRAIAGHRGLGFKLRSGGVEAKAFPSPEQIAFAIATCRDAGVPMKFTAGLHHPVRHFNDSVNTKMHGFLNVFVACVLENANKIGEDRVRAILEDEDPKKFTFTDDGLRWGDLAASTQQVIAARRDFAISFGSCSFDEPREDLRALGFM